MEYKQFSINKFSRFCIACFLLLFLNAENLFSQIDHPSIEEVGAAGLEEPQNVVFRIGASISGENIEYVGGDYFGNPPKNPSTLFKPLKGKVIDVFKENRVWYIEYEPYPFVEGLDEFTYNVVFDDGTEGNFTASVVFEDASRKPYLLEDDLGFSIGKILSNELTEQFPENQRTAFSFTLFDPEPDYGNFSDYLASGDSATITLDQGNNEFFELLPDGNPVLKNGSAVGLNGVVRNYQIRYKSGVSPPDFEMIDDPSWNVVLIVTDKTHGTQRYTLNLSLSDVYEPPQPLKFLVPSIVDDDSQIFRGKQITIPERNFGDSKNDAPFIKIEFKVRSEGQDRIVDNNKTYKFKYNISFDQSGTDSFKTEDNKTVVLNMYDTLSVPPGSDFVPYNPERVYLYTADFNNSKLSAQPNPESDLSIFQLARNEYPAFDNDQPVLLKSSKSYGLVIYFADDYFTFDEQPVTFEFTAEDGDSSDLLFDLEVNIENDFSDPIMLQPISQVNEEEFRLLESQDSDSEFFITFQENHPNNLGLKVLNFDSRDADRHPHAEMQLDFNNSTGAFEFGAGIFYNLQGESRNLFEIDSKGILYFKEMPNYEVLFNAGNSNFQMDIGVHDSPLDLQPGVADITTSDPNVKLHFTIIDGPDLPVLKNPKTFFNSFTKENEPLDLYRFFTDQAVQNFLEADDEDGTEGLVWGSSGFSQEGGTVAFNLNENNFVYTPPAKFFGSDSLQIFYYDSYDLEILGEDKATQYLNFQITVTNKNDDPTLGFIFAPGGSASFFKGGIPLSVSDYQDANGNLILEFNENEPISLKLPFSDVLDRQNIISVNQEGSIDKFSVSKPYQDARYNNLDDAEYLWFVDVNWTAPEAPDYESVEGSDKSYSILLTAVDEVNDYSSFPITIKIKDVPEPPYFKTSRYSDSVKQIGLKYTVPEEFTGAILELTPTDPEGIENVLEWNWRISDDSLGKDQSRYFRLEYEQEYSEIYETTSSDVPKIRLLFNPDQRPSYEDFFDQDINVSVNVTSYSGIDPVTGEELLQTGKLQTISIVLKPENDPPKIRNGIPRDVDESILLTIDEAFSPTPLPYTRDASDLSTLWLLDNLFFDEDLEADGSPQKLQYSVALSDQYKNNEDLRNSLQFQDTMTVKNNRLYFTKFPNFEDVEEASDGQRKGKVMVRIQDPQVTMYQIITIKVEDINDPPVVIATQLPSSSPGEIIEWREDEGPFIEDLRKLVKDEDKYAWEATGLQFEVSSIVNEEGFLLSNDLIDFKRDDQGDFNLQFSPEVHASGIFTVEYVVTDNDFIVPGQVSIHILEVQDAPVIELDTEFLENNPQISKSYQENDLSLVFHHNEGQRTIARFNVSDAFDQLKYREFEFTVKENSGDFKITPQGSNTYQLEWDLDPLKDFGVPYFEELGSGPFDFELTISEDNADQSVDFQRTYSIRVILEEVADKNPVFENRDYSLLIPEGQIEIGTFSAIDPDYEKDLSFKLDPRFKDSGDFDLNLITTPNGQASQFSLAFGNGLSTDYDNFFIKKFFEVRVIATEEPQGQIVKSTSQDFTIEITNVEEVPYFENNGTLFSTNELSADIFPVTVSTDDFNKSLSISLSSLQDKDNFLFEYVDQLGGFRFIRPPDFESPEDQDGDNIYEVSLRVTAPGGTFGEGNFFVEVKDVDKNFYILPLNQREFNCTENTKFIHSFSFVDEEISEQDFPDLYTASGELFGFWPNTKRYQGSSAEIDLIFDQNVFTDFGQIPLNFVLPGDFNGSGRTDFIVFSENRIKYLKNLGGRNFSEISVPNLYSAYDDDEDVPDRTPVFARFADLTGDGLRDLVVVERFTDASSEIIPQLRYFAGDASGNMFESVQKLDFMDVANQFFFDRFELVDLDQDFDLDLIIPMQSKNIGSPGKIVWFENKGDGTFEPEKRILEMTQPKFVIGFNFDSVDFPGKTLGASEANEFKHKDLLIGGAHSLYIARFIDGEVKAGADPIFQQEGSVLPIRFLQISNFNGGKPDIIWSDRESTRYLLGETGDPYYTLGKPFEFRVNNQSYAMQSMAIMQVDDSTRLLYFNSTATQEMGVRLNRIIIPNDSNLDEPIQFDDSYAGIEVEKFGKIGLAELDSKKDFVDFQILPSSPDYRHFDDQRFRESGMLFFDESPNFEDPRDFDRDGIYELNIQITKKNNRMGDVSQTAFKSIFIEVTDINEPPRLEYFTPGSTEHKHSEHFRVVGMVNFENPETFSSVKQELRFSVSGKDEEFFDINESSGELYFKTAPDFDVGDLGSPVVGNRYEVQVLVEEVNGESSDSILMFIKVVDGDEPPQFYPSKGLDANFTAVASDNTSIDMTLNEDEKKVFYLSDLNASDPADNKNSGLSSFVISQKPEHGELWFSLSNDSSSRLDSYLAAVDQNFSGVELHYQPDPNFNGSDRAVITCFNRSSHPANDFNLSDELIVNFEVKPENDYPVITLPKEVTILENSSVVQSLKDFGDDPDLPDSLLTWAFEDPQDLEVFKIEDKILKFKFKSLADYERNNQHIIELSLSSGQGERMRKTYHTLIVNLDNEADREPESKYLEDFARTSGWNIKIAEKSIVVANLEILDPDGFGILDQQLGGNDLSFFTLSPDGNLSVSESFPDGLSFNDPQDQDRNNRYDLTLFLEDSESNKTYHFSVEIVEPPQFIGLEEEYTISENTKLVTEIFAVSAESNVSDFKVIGGADQELFGISNLNSLIFKKAPDYERPLDFYRENRYEVEIRASDGFLEVAKVVEVYVRDENDRPTLKTTEYTVLEDGVLAKRFNFVDDENDSIEFLSYTLPEHGELSIFGLDFLYQPQANYYGTDSFAVTLRDDQEPDINRTTSISIEVNATNDPPVAVQDHVYYHDLRKSFPIYFNVLSNDHSGPDENGTEELEVVNYSLPEHGLLNKRGRGLFSYTPIGKYLDANNLFVGVDSFTYTLRDSGGLTSPGEVSICIAKHQEEPAWTFFRNFGYYYEADNWTRNSLDEWSYTSKNKWIYSEKLGWIYVYKPKDLFTATWIWHDILGWFWTGERHFAWLYSHEIQKWLYLGGQLNHSTSWQLEDDEGGTYKMDDFRLISVRNDVIEILPDLAELSDYVVKSNFFSSAQKLSIITEINRYKRSNTLNQILEFDFQY